MQTERLVDKMDRWSVRLKEIYARTKIVECKLKGDISKGRNNGVKVERRYKKNKNSGLCAERKVVNKIDSEE